MTYFVKRYGRRHTDGAEFGMFGNEPLCLWHNDEGADLI